MNKHTLFFTIIFALFLHSCKSTKQVQPAVADTPAPIIPIAPIAKFQTADELILYSIQQRSNFNWFSANFSGSINLDGDRNNFNGQIRIKNGEQIWMTVTALGGLYEIARLKITTDSVFIYNRHERTATIRDFGFFKEMTGVDFTFDMLQDVLLGNYFLDEPDGRYSYEYSEGNYLFIDERMLGDVAFDFVLHNAHYKFVSLTMRDAQNRSVRANYDGYAIFNDNLYPQNLSVQMREPMTLDLKLNYQRIQINVPQSMPFSIPESVQKN
ncbi:MAG: DUF4292 domain-containing protein [Bacteroidales bacterium]|jgi:hypothetical protein|nr:DUF4292 domain-containing protein [Bacteroidales bacterium]